MTTPTVVPTGYAGDDSDFARAPGLLNGGAFLVQGTVSVPTATAADAYVGIIPFRKGFRAHLDSVSIHCGNFGAATTTVNLGYIYDDHTTYTNDVDAWAAADAAPQSGGFVAVDLVDGLSFVAAADGWLVVQLLTANADATADITFNFSAGYGGYN